MFSSLALTSILRFVQTFFFVSFLDGVELQRGSIPNFDLHAAIDVFETDASGRRQRIGLMKLFTQLFAGLLRDRGAILICRH